MGWHAVYYSTKGDEPIIQVSILFDSSCCMCAWKKLVGYSCPCNLSLENLTFLWFFILTSSYPTPLYLLCTLADWYNPPSYLFKHSVLSVQPLLFIYLFFVSSWSKFFSWNWAAPIYPPTGFNLHLNVASSNDHYKNVWGSAQIQPILV